MLYLLERQASPVNWVFIHGWGSDRSLWLALRSALSERMSGSHYVVDLPGFGQQKTANAVCLESYILELGEALPDHCVLVGWSLGGMLATRLAQRFPTKVKALITLACNPCFTEREQWPCAMSQKTFEQFQQGFNIAPAKTWARFCSLQAQGCDSPKELLKQLKQQAPPDETSIANWQQGLEWLAEMDNRQVLESIATPSLHLLGEGDGLVPSSVANDIDGLGFAQVRCLESAGHCLHLSHTAQTSECLYDWLTNQGLNTPPENDRAIDKRKIARSFGLAAKSYDSVAQLQRKVAESLVVFGADKIASLSRDADRILDLGCGTGYISQIVSDRSRFEPCGDITLLDLAEPMVNFAKAKLLSGHCRDESVSGVCGDAEALPFRDRSFDAVISSLAVQWCSNLSVLGEEVSRVLAKDGYFLFSTLGPGTLTELKQSWSAINHFVHVNHFKAVDVVKSEIEHAGLVVEAIHTSIEVMQYTRVLPILKDLKSLGAHNMNVGQNPGLTSVKQLKAFGQEYEKFRTKDGYLPVTYDVIMVLAKKRQPIEIERAD